MKRLIILLYIVTSAIAVSAYKGDITFTQADNSTFHGNLHGDEWFNYIKTKDNYVVKHNNDNNNYEYMLYDTNQEKLIYSGYKVNSISSGKNTNQAPATIPSVIKKIDDKTLNKLWKKARAKNQK